MTTMNSFRRRSVPLHVHLMPDGSRRYAKSTKSLEAESYNKSRVVITDFLDLCLHELDLPIVSLFLASAVTFDDPRRSIGNLVTILETIGGFAHGITAGHSNFDLTKVGFRVLTLPESEWLAPPDRAKANPELSNAWEKMRNQLDKLNATWNGQPQVVYLLIKYSGSAELRARLDGTISEIDMVPPIGLMIRTSPDLRMSDGPAAAMFDAHIHRIPKLFPTVTRNEFRSVICRYLPISSFRAREHH